MSARPVPARSRRTPLKAPLKKAGPAWWSTAGRALMTPGAARIALHLLVWSATLTGIVWGLGKLEPVALASLQSGPWRIQWVSTPTWFVSPVSDIIEADIDARLDQLNSVEFGNAWLAKNIHEEIAASAWVATVRSVVKRSDGVILVDADFRRPFTRIEHKGVTYLVDEKGWVLPRIDRADSRPPDGSIYLEGVEKGPPGIGHQWPGADVQGGLKTIAFLYENGYASLLPHILAVNVRDFSGKARNTNGRVRLRVVGDGFVEWGLPPGEEADIEATALDKFAKLSAYFQEHGQVPVGADLRYRQRDKIFAKPNPTPASPANTPSGARG